LLALLGVVIAEIASPSVRHVFSNYAASLNLLSGFVALAFTASIVDQIVERRASLHWQMFAGLS
jgi:hypothetical protein